MLPADMTSLPMPVSVTPAVIRLPGVADACPSESEQFLLRAFRNFADASASLERSYGMLHSEVTRLRGELEQSNAGLALSLKENRQMRRHLDRILEGLPCGVLVTNSEEVISLLNPEGRRLLGSVGEELAGDCKSLSALPEHVRALLLRAQSKTEEQEFCLGNGSGGERWLAARHATVGETEPRVGGGAEPENDEPEKDEPGKDCESIFILRDVSDGKRLVRERDRLRREQALAEMSATLAHEIRNPLGSLELFAGLLAGAALSAECRKWVEQVQAGLRTLGATVNNVLHFHSLPAPQRAPTDLGQLLDWAGSFLSPMARRARVELCVRNHLRGVCFEADRHRLEQVLLNLVLNALRAMPGGGWVEIAGHAMPECKASEAVISVSDTGPGIAAEEMPRLFEPGFSTHPGSPGLGLAVCRKIVEQHSGSITAVNRPGAGARFTLTLPLSNSTRSGEVVA